MNIFKDSYELCKANEIPLENNVRYNEHEVGSHKSSKMAANGFLNGRALCYCFSFPYFSVFLLICVVLLIRIDFYFRYYFSSSEKDQRNCFNKKRIPTRREALGRLLYGTITDRLKLLDAASIAANEVSAIWAERRRTSLLRPQRTIIQSLTDLHDKYYKMKSGSTRFTPNEIAKRKRFDEDLEQEFDIKLNPRAKKQRYGLMENRVQLLSKMKVLKIPKITKVLKIPIMFLML